MRSVLVPNINAGRRLRLSQRQEIRDHAHLANARIVFNAGGESRMKSVSECVAHRGARNLIRDQSHAQRPSCTCFRFLPRSRRGPRPVKAVNWELKRLRPVAF